MPQLGADMEAGTLVRWLKQPGDRVSRGDIIAIVETEKGAIEIEVFESGVFGTVVVAPGQKVPVGTVLAHIQSDGEPAIPAAVPATAPTQPATSPPADDSEAAHAMRHAITAAMSRAKREIPHVYLSTTVDMTPALAWLHAHNERVSVEQRVLPIALMIRAVAKAVADVPEVNGWFVDGAFQRATAVDVGCAVALRTGGLVAPAVHQADSKTVAEVMSALSDLVARARKGALRSSELSDPTITVTNLGDLGVEQAYAIINPPQVAIVAFGRLIARPWVVEGRVEPRTVLHVSVSADHRVIDGRRGGQFLAAIEQWLQKPEQL
jgi:pyruvate dehydrogenase E2 component (dihydrolipoamide acetyltransferase)